MYLRRKNGFTLIELIVVIAILGILAAVLVPSIGNYVTKAKLNTRKDTLKTIYSACLTLISDYENDDIDGNELIDAAGLAEALLNERNIIVGVDSPMIGDTAEMSYILYDLTLDVALNISFWDGEVKVLEFQNNVFTEY